MQRLFAGCAAHALFASVWFASLVALSSPAAAIDGVSDDCPGQCAGDRDNNATVDAADLATLLGAWQLDSPCDDLNHDGIVDSGDLSILLASWGPCPAFGACCLPDTMCEQLNVYDCQTVLGGVFLGAATRCEDPVCTQQEEPLGACFLPEQEWCLQLSASACALVGGEFAGAGVECAATVACQCTGDPETCASLDCNGNGIIDRCEIASGAVSDCNGNGIPDECEDDCDQDGIPDACQPLLDCNGNGMHDPCEDPAGDRDGNHIPDECDIAAGRLADCDGNLIPDAYDSSFADCNGNGVPDSCDIASGAEADCNRNGVPDSCESLPDCDSNGVPDACELANGDCNANGIPDICELATGDLNGNGVLDECEFKCAPDLDVDSDNSGAIDGTSLEDQLETLNPGRVLIAGTASQPGAPVPLLLSTGCPDAPVLWSITYPSNSLAISLDRNGLVPLASGVEMPSPPPSTIWMRGLAASASEVGSEGVDIVLTVRQPLGARAGDKKAKDAVKVKVVAPSVTRITFDGAVLWTFVSDVGDKMVARPQWRDDPLVESPFMLVRTGGAPNAARSVVANFKADAKYTGTLRVKASSNHGIAIEPTTLTFKDGVAANQKLNLTAVPETVERFTDFELTWTFEAAHDGVFGGEQKTKNPLFIVNALPAEKLLNQSSRLDRLYVEYLKLSCGWAAGKKGNADVLDAIWSNLKTRTATSFGYFCPVVPELVNKKNALDLIADKNGRCGQWSTLLIRLGETHGIDLDRLAILSDFKVAVGGQNVLFPTLAVKNWRIANPNRDVWEGNRENKEGLPGQTPPETVPPEPLDPPCKTPHLKLFADHAAVIMKGSAAANSWRIFDPSYGTEFGPDTLDNVLKAMDDASIDFFLGRTIRVVNGRNAVNVTPWRANPPGNNLKHDISER